MFFIIGGDRNPYTVKPNFENWAPWIGRETRKGPSILNTEWQKVHSTNPQGSFSDMDVTEERLCNEVEGL